MCVSLEVDTAVYYVQFVKMKHWRVHESPWERLRTVSPPLSFTSEIWTPISKDK